jgi:hypothetical protein
MPTGGATGLMERPISEADVCQVGAFRDVSQVPQHFRSKRFRCGHRSAQYAYPLNMFARW